MSHEQDLSIYIYKDFLKELKGAKTPEAKRKVRIMFDALKLASLQWYVDKKVQNDDEFFQFTPEAEVAANLTNFVLSKHAEGDKKAVQICSKLILERTRKFNECFESKYK